MDYSSLLSRAWNTLWKNKFLILLGMLAVLGTGGGGGSHGGGGRTQSGGQPNGSIADFCNNLPRQLHINTEGAAIISVVLLLVVGLVLLGLILWPLSRIGEGGLINGVSELESGRPSGFVSAFSAGRGKIWQLLGIDLIAGIPGILLFVVAVVVGIQFVAGTNWQAICAAGDNPSLSLFGGLTTAPLIMLLVCVPLGLVGLVLAAIRTFADRACMTENLGVLASYERGWSVLRENLGSALAVFVVQLIVSVLLGLVLFVPVGVMTCCWCIFWPVLWALRGGTHAYFSTLWTLSWRQWTGATGDGEPGGMVIPAPSAPPAV